jgi:hypothetical protein
MNTHQHVNEQNDIIQFKIQTLEGNDFSVSIQKSEAEKVYTCNVRDRSLNANPYDSYGLDFLKEAISKLNGVDPITMQLFTPQGELTPATPLLPLQNQVLSLMIKSPITVTLRKTQDPMWPTQRVDGQVYGWGKQLVSTIFRKAQVYCMTPLLTTLTKPTEHSVTTSGPRYVCGTSAAVMFATTSFVVHPAAMCTAVGAVVYHIAYPDNRLAYLLDLTCNTMTAIYIVPHMPTTSWFILLFSGLNWALFRHTQTSQWQHVLQVTFPLCVICYTYH